MRADNQPQTFERRGTTVPFHDRDLAHTRVREYFHGEERRLDAVIPNYTGGRRGELVVMPWEKVGTLGSLNSRDEAIVEAVARTRNTRDLDPIRMRELCLKCDAEHGLEPEVQQRAAEIVKQDEDDKAIVRLSFIAELTRECGIERGDPLMMHANTKTLMELMGQDSGRSQIDLDLLIERVMVFAAERTNSTVTDVKSYLDPLVGMLTPFGNVTAPGEEKNNGFLYLQHTDLIGFRQELDAYQPEVREELEGEVIRILAAADECIAFINGRLGILNGMLGQLADMFDQSLGVVDKLEAIRRDVGYGLDGWADMIQVWRDAYRGREAIGGELAMERAIRRIGGYAPRIPSRELDPEHSILTRGTKYETAKVKMVQQMHSWDNDLPDYELKARFEKAQKRAGADADTDGEPKTPVGKPT